jgi:hypothetical protein
LDIESGKHSTQKFLRMHALAIFWRKWVAIYLPCKTCYWSRVYVQFFFDDFIY